MKDTLSPEQKLVSAARSGDVGAFEQLYRAYNDRIYNFARRVVGSDQDASDVVQETFIRAWQALPKLRSDVAFRSWLYSIALSRSREMLSKQSKRRESSAEFEPNEESSLDRQTASQDDGPEPTALRAETKAAVDNALAELSDEHRSVVAMHHLQDMDVSGVAKALGIPQGTVLSRLARARAVLRRKLAPYMENY